MSLHDYYMAKAAQHDLQAQAYAEAGRAELLDPLASPERREEGVAHYASLAASYRATADEYRAMAADHLAETKDLEVAS
jgi:hypothetical protein